MKPINIHRNKSFHMIPLWKSPIKLPLWSYPLELPVELVLCFPSAMACATRGACAVLWRPHTGQYAAD